MRVLFDDFKPALILSDGQDEDAPGFSVHLVSLQHFTDEGIRIDKRWVANDIQACQMLGLNRCIAHRVVIEWGKGVAPEHVTTHVDHR